MNRFDRTAAERILKELDDSSRLFPQFALSTENDQLKLLGAGGFSLVYEMFNRERPELKYAVKVSGFQRHLVTSEDFSNSVRIQWILCQESHYILRLLDSKELNLSMDTAGVIKEMTDDADESSKKNENTLYLQFVLMEKLDRLIEKDRFGRVSLLREQLHSESEVLKFALEIGQGLAAAHNNNCLHRDIKLENAFYDPDEQIYKLGDYDVSKQTEDGNAETIVYTDGYGAPEIIMHNNDRYTVTADIYSLGITLYLLLNNMRFPGSDGYYAKTEIQYDPEFVFPAPAGASEVMAGIIRKMCSFHASDRYQNMYEVLVALTQLIDSESTSTYTEEIVFSSIETETYKPEITDSDDRSDHTQSRAERKREQRIKDSIYREDSFKYFLSISLLLTLMLKGLQPDTSMVTNWIFYVLPAAVLLEAVFQSVKEFHLFFGTLVLVFAGFSVYSVGLTVPHALLILCVLIGCPPLTFAGTVSTGLWILLEISGALPFLNQIYAWDLGAIVLTIVLFVIRGLFSLRIRYNRVSDVRAYLGSYIYDKLFIVMAVIGVILIILDKSGVITVPDTIGRLHLLRTGITGFLITLFLHWWDRLGTESVGTAKGDKTTAQ